MTILIEKTIDGRRVTLRPPIVADAERLAEYWFGPASAHLLPYTDLSVFGTKDNYLANMRTIFAGMSQDGPWSALVAEIDGQAAGNVLINGLVPGEEALVHVHLWDPGFRRAGIARALAFEVFRYFLNAFHLKRLCLQIPNQNEPVLRLLNALGLKAEGVHFGKAAPVCKEGHYTRYIITEQEIPKHLGSSAT